MTVVNATSAIEVDITIFMATDVRTIPKTEEEHSQTTPESTETTQITLFITYNSSIGRWKPSQVTFQQQNRPWQRPDQHRITISVESPNDNNPTDYILFSIVILDIHFDLYRRNRSVSSSGITIAVLAQWQNRRHC